MTVFSPGDLVRARGREWVAMPSPDPELLYLRPLSGSEGDVQVIHPALEREAPRPARFEPPEIGASATQENARLLAEALRLALRRGAGPFRSAGRVGFEPRAYQLVPLLMALRQSTIRLLVADDVGIGKTVEAGLILREMIDRGEVDRFSVLCPPHLVEQWTGELRSKFDLDTVAITAASAPRLERELPNLATTLFDAHPHTVVSLDYIKADKRRDAFARACPGFVIVDEAHACVGTHKGKQQRFGLLSRLASDAERHMVFLTATPHSGDEEAFDRLLGLVQPDFNRATLESDTGRARLQRHFVQRRRIDVTGREWNEERAFPRHETAEAAYPLSAEHKAFHDAVLDYCLGIVEGAGTDERRRRLAFWGTLALMRCVGSSPAAAISALRNRAGIDPDRIEPQVFDDDADESDAVDVEPATAIGDEELTALITQADRLTKSPDPKLNAVVKLLKPLVEKGSNPVVFCRFIATAEHVAEGLRKAFPKLRVECVTGALTTEDRRARVEEMGEAERRLLVATDCLSEGVNLQQLFDAVVHYDLSWNPTRHQQREGRIDRFGQPSTEVHSVLVYSPDSAIDGAVLDVILRKAEAIRKATGVTVPLPDERGAVTGALMAAVMLRKGAQRQMSLDLGLANDTRAMELRWKNAEEGERRSRARFAQNALQPALVAPEWQRWRDVMGSPAEVRRFLDRAMSRFNAPLEETGKAWKAHLATLPATLSERLSARNLEGTIRIAFEEPAPARAEVVGRNHPLTATLAEALLEGALDPTAGGDDPIGRSGAWQTKAVTQMTTLVLLRLRNKLNSPRRMLLAEEAAVIAFGPTGDDPIATGEEARKLLDAPATSTLADVARERTLAKARQRLVDKLLAENGPIETFARRRARELADDHARVREASASRARVEVEAILPADVIGLYVLLPAV